MQLNREHLWLADTGGGGTRGWVSALMSTSGCAKAATGEADLADQHRLMATLAEVSGTRREHVLAMSTGLIGTRLPVDRVADAIRTSTSPSRRVTRTVTRFVPFVHLPGRVGPRHLASGPPSGTAGLAGPAVRPNFRGANSVVYHVLINPRSLCRTDPVSPRACADNGGRCQRSVPGCRG